MGRNQLSIIITQASKEAAERILRIALDDPETARSGAAEIVQGASDANKKDTSITLYLEKCCPECQKLWIARKGDNYVPPCPYCELALVTQERDEAQGWHRAALLSGLYRGDTDVSTWAKWQQAQVAAATKLLSERDEAQGDFQFKQDELKATVRERDAAQASAANAIHDYETANQALARAQAGAAAMRAVLGVIKQLVVGERRPNWQDDYRVTITL